MLDPGKQERIAEFLRQSLLGEELVNTQFHLFSAKSSSSGRVLKPRVLCANNVLLAKSSKYFLDLLSSDTNTSDPSLVDLADDNDVPGDVTVDDYGYESDSDLDDWNVPIPVTSVRVPKNRSATLSTSPRKIRSVSRSKDDDEVSEDGSESDSSDMFVMSPEQPKADELFSVNKDGDESVASSKTAVRKTGDKTSVDKTATRLRSLASRHILVKDTAFQTWYTLLNYLYTDKFSFLPLGSATPDGQVHESSMSSLYEPKCSAKSMYRLACKVGLDHLHDEALSYIRRNLTDQNILKELSCNLVSKYPQLLEMELDVLYSYIASPPVVADFPTLARRIANKELAHGADIIVGIHARLLRAPYPRPLIPAPRVPSGLFGSSKLAEPAEESSPPGTEAEHVAGSCFVGPQTQAFVGMAKPAATPEKGPKVAGKANRPKGGTSYESFGVSPFAAATSKASSRSSSPQPAYAAYEAQTQPDVNDIPSSGAQPAFGWSAFGQSAFGQSTFGGPVSCQPTSVFGKVSAK